MPTTTTTLYTTVAPSSTTTTTRAATTTTTIIYTNHNTTTTTTHAPTTTIRVTTTTTRSNTTTTTTKASTKTTLPPDSTTKHKIDIYTAQYISLLKSIAAAQNDIDKWTARVQSVQPELPRLESDLATRHVQLNAINATISNYMKQAARNRIPNATVLQQIGIYKTEQAAALKSVSALVTQINNIKTTVTQLQASIKLKVNSLKTLNAQLASVGHLLWQNGAPLPSL